MQNILAVVWVLALPSTFFKTHSFYSLNLFFLIVRGVCNFLGSVLPQQKFEAVDGPVLPLRVTAHFYLQAKENTFSRREDRPPTQKTQREKCANARERGRNRERELWLPFLYVFFPLPLGLPYVNWASQEGCLFYLRSSDLSLFYFQGLFPSLSFNHCHSGLLFPILTT